MKYPVAVGLGIGVAVLGAVLVARGAYELTRLSSCIASNLTVVTVCPQTGGGDVGSLVMGVFCLIIGPVIFALRGGANDGRGPRNQLVGSAWVALFGSLAFGIWLGANGEGALSDGGIASTILVTVFTLLALVPLIGTVRVLLGGGHPQSVSAGTGASTAAAPSQSDLLHERLQEMESRFGTDTAAGDDGSDSERKD